FGDGGLQESRRAGRWTAVPVESVPREPGWLFQELQKLHDDAGRQLYRDRSGRAPCHRRRNGHEHDCGKDRRTSGVAGSEGLPAWSDRQRFVDHRERQGIFMTRVVLTTILLTIAARAAAQ